jgi:hypothetical protein
MFIKFSYLAFYLCLMPDRRSRIFVYAGIAFVAAIGITFTTLAIFMCTPIQRGWDRTIEGTCVEEQPYLFSNAAFNMAADVMVFVMPIPTLWGLQRESLGDAAPIAWTAWLICVQFPCGKG